MSEYTFVQFSYHCDQYIDDQLEFFKVKVNQPTNEQIAAYKAGAKAGALNAYNLIKLHTSFRLKND